MGYHAFVRCNCAAEGIATVPPPFPFAWDVDDRAMPYPLTPACTNDDSYDDSACQQQKIALYRWLQGDHCQHEHSKAISMWLATEFGMIDFKVALEKIGATHFPVLSTYLPIENNGYVPFELTEALLEEVYAFAGIEQIGLGVYLINTHTDDVIVRGTRPGIGEHSFTLGDIGIDDHGLFVRSLANRNDNDVIGQALSFMNDTPADTDTETEVFRANRVEQQLVGPDADDYTADSYLEKTPDHLIRLINLDTGDEHVSDIGVSKLMVDLDFAGTKTVYPRFIHVEQHPFGAEAYEYITKKLLQLAEVALAVGNPICWD